MTTIEHDLAVKIVDKLFTNHNGDKAGHLRLEQCAEKSLGVTFKDSAIEQVKQVLEAELKLSPQQPQQPVE